MSTSAYAGNRLQAAADPDGAWTKLFDLFEPGKRVLDLGCSSGNFGKALIDQKQCQVVGIDINEDDLKLAANHLTRALKLDLEREELTDLGAFDYVLMADVIEHMANPVPVLRKVKKVLAKNGRLIFSVPNMANIATRIELLGGRFEYTTYGILDQTHLHYYDKIEFETVLARAGFKVELYNNTVRDLPESVLIAQLKKLGLTPSARFLRSARQLEATTFQFIGRAKPVVKLARQTEQLATKSPHDFMSSAFDAVYQQLGDTQRQLNKQQRQYRKALADKILAEAAMQRAQAELEAIQNSKGWRMLRRAHSVKHRLTKARRQISS